MIRPTVFPSNNYLTPNDKKDEFSVSKENYVKMYKEGKLEGHVIDQKLINEIENQTNNSISNSKLFELIKYN